jgi:hypothetical protein
MILTEPNQHLKISDMGGLLFLRDMGMQQLTPMLCSNQETHPLNSKP